LCKNLVESFSCVLGVIALDCIHESKKDNHHAEEPTAQAEEQSFATQGKAQKKCI